jgi:SAM-dependent methyltransferase
VVGPEGGRDADLAGPAEALRAPDISFGEPARGTAGYAEQAPTLIERYEAIPFAEKHKAFLDLIPLEPSTVLDVGAGTGADAAWLANRGHRVLAIEPTSELRAYGMARHSSPRIEWLDDCLPRLDKVLQSGRTFDRILASAVWMHLDERERSLAMPVLASLLAGEGALLMSIRHGPVPDGRVMFEVSSRETIALASSCGLGVLLDVRTPSVQAANSQAGIMWSQLAFKRNAAAMAEPST